ncbi:Cof-type HAD-IIB family hydrolase [Paenibacillus senegalensis]|uniref:Cof-type HAD-IIB family hydrolase n=1 Tax=Paenibacillus senegalensis TaxID=1465766 RepID=UPI0002897DF8|nr:Cof-type HAD-IIB family hydrolase [Paenibacillus senegalensis]
MNEIRLIVSDLDGTLLSEDHQLSDAVKRSIRRFREAGGWFTFATGRFGPSTRSIVEELDIEIPFILCNGSVLADRHKIWEMATLSLEELAPLLKEADQNGLTVMFFNEKGIRTMRHTEEVRKFELKESVQCECIDPQSGIWGGDDTVVQKVLLIGDMNEIHALWRKYQGTFRLTYATAQSENDFFEILPPNQSKGTALQKLMKVMQVTPDQVMSIGNQLNDVDMLERSGIGVAVANSHPDLKQKATYVCQEGYGDGVVEAMNKFVFIKE